jgi:hypothetical protein
VTVTEFVSQLNEYRGDNIWEDVIRHHPDYDDDATAEADPTGASDTICLTDGTIIDYNHQTKTWNPR